MKVHELVDLYKQGLDELKAEFERAVKREEHDIAFLQSLNPMADVNPALWDDYTPIHSVNTVHTETRGESDD